ncbi:MAG: hypothetical protein CVT60_06335, partial [Actinobacteria bacterium HGW-Actinobacteria-10]
RDVSARSKTEAQLRESESLYRALIETTGTGYVVLDGDETATVPVLDPDTASAALPRESGWLTFLDALFGFK